MSSTLLLNCLELGDKPNHIFPVEIAATETVYALKKAIKAKKEHELRYVDANELDIWNVSISADDDLFEEKLHNLDLDPEKRVWPVKRLSEVFSDLDEESLHVIVGAPTRGLLELNCFVLGDKRNNIFLVKIAATETVYALKEAIKAKKEHAFRNIDANEFVMWNISIPVDKNFEATLEELSFNKEDSLFPIERLFKVFPNVPVDDHLHIVVQRPDDIRRKRAYSEPEETVLDRLKRTKIATITPSTIARSTEYEELQRHPLEKILDDRPEPDVDIPPIPLLYEGFGHFLEILDGRDDVPGLADIDVPKLRKAVDDFASEMVEYFDNEDLRRDAGLPGLDEIFSARRGTVIPSLHAAGIGSIRSNGHNIATHGPGTIIVDLKNGVTGIDAIPHIEIVGYFAHLIANMDTDAACRQLYLGWRVPCLGLTIIGHEIAFYAIVAIDHRFRVISLTPSLSCIQSASDGRDRTSLYKAFTVASVLQAHILQDTEKLLSNPPNPIPASMRHFPAVSKLLKYPLSPGDYLTFRIGAFFPDRQPNRLVYIAETSVDKQFIIIKFTRRYSIELHDFCAKAGHAPQILAFERLPGGWFAVVMEFIESGLAITHVESLSDHRKRWVEELQHLVDGFLAQGLVHGDLRNANIICKEDSMMLIDFDWGGKDGEVSYPTVDLNEELLEGRRFSDLIIRKEDDQRVLRKTLDKLADKV